MEKNNTPVSTAALLWGEKALSEAPGNYRHQQLVSEARKKRKE